jgi:hypothetical protein
MDWAFRELLVWIMAPFLQLLCCRHQLFACDCRSVSTFIKFGQGHEENGGGIFPQPCSPFPPTSDASVAEDPCRLAHFLFSQSFLTNVKTLLLSPRIRLQMVRKRWLRSVKIHRCTFVALVSSGTSSDRLHRRSSAMTQTRHQGAKTFYLIRWILAESDVGCPFSAGEWRCPGVWLIRSNR